jgi:hypothetical protein
MFKIRVLQGVFTNTYIEPLRFSRKHIKGRFFTDREKPVGFLENQNEFLMKNPSQGFSKKPLQFSQLCLSGFF